MQPLYIENHVAEQEEIRGRKKKEQEGQLVTSLSDCFSIFSGCPEPVSLLFLIGFMCLFPDIHFFFIYTIFVYIIYN